MENEDRAWIDYREIFANQYNDMNYANGLQGFVMKAGHKLSEKHFPHSVHFSRVLEIGAGTGEHFEFVKHGFDDYVVTDHDQKALARAQEKLAAIHAQNISYEVQSGSGLSFEDNSFDRIFAGHVLEHIYQPHLALKEWARVLKNGGTLSILIPTDPGIAWRLGRHFGPRKNALAQGIAYDYVMAREHVNSCNNLIALLKHYFPNSSEHWWPFPIASIDLNLFYVYHAVIEK